MLQVLVADDEEIEVRALEMMIRHDFPGEAELVPDAKNGLQLIAHIQKYQPDIVIADINMPGMNGLEALELMRAKYPRMKILISTAYNDFDYIRRALKLGAADYLLKPVSRDTFLKTFSAVLAKAGQEQSEADDEKKIRQAMGEMQSIAGDEFLSSLLLGDAAENSFHHFLRSLPHPYHGAVVMMARPGSGEKEAGLLEKSLQKEISAILSRYCSLIGKLYQGDLYFLIFLPDEMDDDRCVHYLTDLSRFVTKQLKGQDPELEFGFSRIGRYVQEIETCLEESRLAFSGNHPDRLYFYQNRTEKEKAEVSEQARQKVSEMLREEKKNAEKPLSDHLRQAVLYMRQHYEQDLALDEVASQAGISPFYLSRLFRQELRCTFVEEMTQIRMEQALRLMRQERLSMREIAEKTGYRNVTYFYKVFRKTMGAGAGEVRDMMLSEKKHH